jgi:hypothetical protein
MAAFGANRPFGISWCWLSCVEAGLQRNLDDLPVVETDGAECGEIIVDDRFQFLGERLAAMRTIAESSAGELGRRSAYTNILQKPSIFPNAIATQHRPLPAYALSAGSLALSRQSQMSIAIFPSCAPDSRCEKAVQTRSSG